MTEFRIFALAISAIACIWFLYGATLGEPVLRRVKMVPFAIGATCIFVSNFLQQATGISSSAPLFTILGLWWFVVGIRKLKQE